MLKATENTPTKPASWSKAIERPWVFAGVVVLGLALLPVAVWFDLRTISDASLRVQAEDLDKALAEIRDYYARNVVGRALAADGTVTATHAYMETEGGIPIPATLSIELGDVIGSQSGSLNYRFVSDYPFTNRASHNLSAFEKNALADFRASPDENSIKTSYEGSIFDRRIEIASPVLMGEACVACHNTHPESPKTDWSAGDVRGLQTITVSQPISNNLFAFKYLMLYFAGAGAFGATFAGLQWRQARRFAVMNSDLEKANGEIVHLNRQLASENLRLGAEIEVARQIQMMVLPTKDELGGLQHLEIAAFMEPADEVGGDYYDVLQLNGRVKVGIGDVTGHGLESGVLMLMVQSVATALQEQGINDPKQFLIALNGAICRNIRRTGTDKHLTLSFLDFDADKITLSGQHEDLIVLRSDGGCEIVDTMDLGLPIGLEADIETFVATHSIAFGTGDMVVLYTDGVTEAESPAGDLYGLERLVESAKRRRAHEVSVMLEHMLTDLKTHIGTQTIHDDITLLVIRHR
ncbi:hypothetical protein GCM10011316_20510 [Roseibium aquae]|uniref:PPM-type phosphatase domain-containing protein n=1 Tax=Roseibium aquae TaxID=1323746 RepID=A0A916X1X9_9HYPH|nr:hypothetical protein GCM10011316_20510 [Roseibium aquae]